MSVQNAGDLFAVREKGSPSKDLGVLCKIDARCFLLYQILLRRTRSTCMVELLYGFGYDLVFLPDE